MFAMLGGMKDCRIAFADAFGTERIPLFGYVDLLAPGSLDDILEQGGPTLERAGQAMAQLSACFHSLMENEHGKLHLFLAVIKGPQKSQQRAVPA